MKKTERIYLFVRGIQTWFPAHKRKLPWRDLQVADRDQRAYLVLVSEIMLQQTQVPRVIVLYKNFIQKFPDLKALSKASNAEILIAWRGLGYNSRALRLRDAARIILEEFQGHVPDSMEDLRSISGIGEYTASAVRNFAFGIPTPCLDTNIRRILQRFFYGMERENGEKNVSDAALVRLSGEVLLHALEQGFTCADWYAALMDFGSLVCTKNAPKWEKFNTDLKTSCLTYGKQKIRTKNVNKKKEPGREMAGKYVPNRIFRGRIIEVLRHTRTGCSFDDIGREIAIDWSLGDHQKWLQLLLQKLEKDQMITVKKTKYFLLQ